MSGGPPPREVVGFFKVAHKNPHGELVTVFLVGDSGSCMFTLKPEDADYYVEGESYLIAATRP